MAAVVTEWLEWTFLPSNVTYQTIMDYSSSQAGNQHINIRPKHILHFLAYAMIISVIRRGFEATVAVWLVQAAGIIDQRRKPDRNGDLEASYLEKRSPNDEEMMQLGKKLDLRERYVRNWFRLRRNQDLPSIVHKFVETSWRFAFYTCSLCWGLKALSTAPWFYDTTQCWVNYPNQLLRPDMYYYYMSQGGFYISLLFSVTTDIKRKDFWEMVVHHIATIILISMSYLANFVRIGTLIIAVHDISDVFLESAKLFHYAEWRRTADSIFAVFSVTFLGMRLYVYPRYCLYSSYVESTMEITQPWRGVYIFNVFLFVLQGLHIFWASMLIKMIVRMIIKGQVENDERSDVDEEISQEEDEKEEEIKKDKVKQNNGVHSPCG